MTLRDSPQNSAGKKGSDGPNKVVKLTSCAEESFPSGSVVKNSPAKQEMWVRSLGQADPLEKVIATHSNILAWEIPWTEEAGGLQPRGGSQSWTRLIKQQQHVLKRRCLSQKILFIENLEAWDKVLCEEWSSTSSFLHSKSAIWWPLCSISVLFPGACLYDLRFRI